MSRRGLKAGLLEIETTQKFTRNCNKFRPKPKTNIKALSDKDLVGFRISLSVI